MGVKDGTPVYETGREGSIPSRGAFVMVAVAQLAARLVVAQEVAGSSPSGHPWKCMMVATCCGTRGSERPLGER